jgi:hypothetical protein
LGFRAPGCHGLWQAFPDPCANPPSTTSRSHNPGRTSSPGLGFSAFARHYSRNHFRFLFLGLLRCFTSPRVALTDYEFIRQWSRITRTRLSHSEIHGSMPVCGSPWLIAADYVLHRPLAPRHPPIALSSLITKMRRGFPRHTRRNVCPLYAVYSCQRTLRQTPTSAGKITRAGGPDWT